jgi:signal transduction histidine kinase
MDANKPTPGDSAASQQEKIRPRILIPLVVAIGVLLTIFGLGLYQEQRRANERSIARAAQSVQRLLNDDQRRCTETMSMTLEELLNDDRLADALRDQNRAILSERTHPLFENLSRVDKITHFCLYSREGIPLLQKHEAERKQDAASDRMLLAAERTGQSVSGLEQSPLGTFVLRTISPWRREGQTLGYVELGVDLFVAVDKTRLEHGEYQAAAQRVGAQGSWEQFPAAVVSAKTMETIPETAQRYLRRGPGAPEKRDTVVHWRGTVTQIMFLPLNDSERRKMGELIVLRDISQAVAETDQWKLAIGLICLGVSAALAVFFYNYLGRIERTLAEGTVKLREANEQLEERVGQRTSQLRMANADLQHEIARREKAQQELVAAQTQLLAASRQAGMAEVATSVLHNVGNVLNSVSVSACLVCDRLKQSRVANIPRVAALLNENAADLNHFMAHDPKGQPLLRYLDELGRHLGEEQSGILKELESLRENVEHIEEIVSVQQRNAKAVGVNEKARMADLIEDVLRMTSDSLSRHRIQVKREYEPGLPEITVDKHKVFQILANLIHNARQACDARGRADKRLTIRVAREDNYVIVIVSDNGIGIPPENLTRIFNHGFTTRKDGTVLGCTAARWRRGKWEAVWRRTATVLARARPSSSNCRAVRGGCF